MNDDLDLNLDDLFEPGVLDDDEGDADNKPPAPPAPPAALTDAEKESIAREWVQRNNYQPFTARTPVAPAEDDDDDTVAGVIRKEVKKAFTEGFGAFRQEMAPQQGALARPMVVESVKSAYNLNEVEVKELRTVVGRIAPEALTDILNDGEMQKELAALAKGRAFFLEPNHTTAPSTRPTGAITWAAGVKQEDIDKYRLFSGKAKLDKEDYKELKRIGYIL